jgi:AraC-like DNA-binding protein
MGTFHWSLEAVKADEAEDSLRRISPYVQLGRSADPRHRLRFDGDDRFSIVRLEIFGELWGTNEPDETITIPFAVTGRMDWAVGDESGTANLPWLQGTESQTFSRFGPVVELATFLPKGPLLDFGRAFFGDEGFRLAFDGALPVSEAHARYLSAALQYAEQLACSDAFEFPLVRAVLYRQLAVSVFEVFKLEGDHRSRTLTAEGRRRRYRVAAQFIEDYASLPITVEDAAQAAAVSTAELDEIFRGHSPLGVSVREQLRRTRLTAAHADLVEGDPTLGDTVRDVAHRWGFASPSHFARLYRREYGVSPRWTLDR